MARQATRLYQRVRGRCSQARHRAGLLRRRGGPQPRHPRKPPSFLEDFLPRPRATRPSPARATSPPSRRSCAASAPTTSASSCGARHPKKSGGVLRQGGDVTFRFIEGHNGRTMARPPDVRTRWRCRRRATTPGASARPASPGAERREALLGADPGGPRQGEAPLRQPRIHAELRAGDRACSVNTVAKLMRDNGIRASRRPGSSAARPTRNHRLPVADNVLGRRFDPESGQREVGRGHHLRADSRGLPVPGGRGRPLLAAGRGLVDGRTTWRAAWWSMPWRWR